MGKQLVSAGVALALVLGVCLITAGSAGRVEDLSSQDAALIRGGCACCDPTGGTCSGTDPFSYPACGIIPNQGCANEAAFCNGPATCTADEAECEWTIQLWGTCAYGTPTIPCCDALRLKCGTIVAYPYCKCGGFSGKYGNPQAVGTKATCTGTSCIL